MWKRVLVPSTKQIKINRHLISFEVLAPIYFGPSSLASWLFGIEWHRVSTGYWICLWRYGRRCFRFRCTRRRIWSRLIHWVVGVTEKRGIELAKLNDILSGLLPERLLSFRRNFVWTGCILKRLIRARAAHEICHRMNIDRLLDSWPCNGHAGQCLHPRVIRCRSGRVRCA